jgi:predicted MPP superfamily phosphohydrolase
MPMIVLILSAIVAANLTWWRWADNRLRRIPAGRSWRSALAVLILGQLSYLSILVSPRVSHAVQRWVPVPVVASTYLWSLLVLPLSLVVIGLGKLFPFVRRKPAIATQNLVTGSELNRRQMLGAVAVAIPPMVTAGLVMRAVPQLSRFRIRTMHLTLPALPPALDGLRIAHISDLHVGRYTRPTQIPAMVNAVNRLKADLILFTGDLIDISLKDLPRGIAAMKQIDPRHGMAIIEGNHDLIESADEFDRQVRDAGLPLLVDEAMTVIVRNQKVQLLGTRWGESTGNRRRADDAAFAKSIGRLAQVRDPAAFPIVLAHHPHTFDPAAAAGFPLVLSGHTHGGQLMLNSQTGFGPLFYRYWSGLYHKSSSRLVVNNGIGNWFPLRINAPAEIIEIVLHS